MAACTNCYNSKIKLTKIFVNLKEKYFSSGENSRHRIFFFLPITDENNTISFEIFTYKHSPPVK